MEEEKCIYACVIGAAKHKALIAQNSAESRYCKHSVKRRAAAAQAGSAAGAAHLKSEAHKKITDCADEEDHEVHRHCVGGVLSAAETGFNHCKAALEEEDHECANHYPRVVCAEIGLVCDCCNVVQSFAARCGDIRRAGRISTFRGGGDHEEGRD